MSAREAGQARLRRLMLTPMVALALLVGGASGPQIAVAAPDAYRALWVHGFDDTLKSEASIKRLVTDARALGINTLVVQVSRRFDCLCNRSIFPRAEQANLAPPPFDALDTVLEEAHRVGIQVHAWVNSTVLWSLAAPPADQAHPYLAHGPRAPGTDSWLARDRSGRVAPGVVRFIDPGHPDATRFLVEGVLSIVRNYPVDGINLDYIRYPDAPGSVQPYGYSRAALDRYRAETSTTGRPLADDPVWTAWRARQVTQLVRRVTIETQALAPAVRISVNAIVYGGVQGSDDAAWERTEAHRTVLQEWRSWLADGAVDAVFPMNYKNGSKADHRLWYRQWSDSAKDWGSGRHVVMGTGLYLNRPKFSRAQVRRALAPSTNGSPSAGWIGYSYQEPGTSLRPASKRVVRARLQTVLRLGVNAPLRGTARVPDAAWKRDLGAIAGVVKTADGIPVDGVELIVDLPDGSERRVTTDGDGWFGFAALPPGPYSVLIANAPPTAVEVAAASVARIEISLPRP